MADLGSFFNPLIQGWDQYLSDPTTQAALLSFGAQAAQPRQWGQSDFGHLMSSVAQGGAGVRQQDEQERKQEELEIKQREAESRGSLRESQATLAEQRAATAGQGARHAEERLGLRRAELESRERLQGLQRQITAQRLYQDYVRQTQKANENAALMPGGRTVPIQSFQEFIVSNPVMMRNLGLTPESFQQPAPGGAGTGQYPAPTPGATPAPSPAPQGPPPPAASRPDGYVWEHPQRGRLRWDKAQQRWFPVAAGAQ